MMLIKNGLVFDPVKNVTEIRDVYIKDGVFADSFEGAADVVIDATGLAVAPGLVDAHVHFRDPGLTYKEDIITGARSAAAGGVTTALCMPNTSPAIDSRETLEYVAQRAKEACINVLPYAAVTVGQKGGKLTDFSAMKAAGAVALSDDGIPLSSAAVLREAMLNAQKENLLICSHCEDAELVQNYAVNEGAVSRQLKITGRPAIAEEIMVARDILMAGDTGARVHICHVSTKGSVELIRRAKADGINVTCETCPQYFSLTEDEILTKGTLARVNPPLRTKADVEAIIEGLCDGTIDIIVTDHAPHSEEEKSRPLEEAPSGMVGLETSLAVTLTYLYHTGKLSLLDIMGIMSHRMAEIFGLPYGTLDTGASADLVIFNPDKEWIVDPQKFYSKGKNTPFSGMGLKGKIKYTVCGGKVVFKGE